MATLGCRAPAKPISGVFASPGATLELLAGKRFVLQIGADRIEGETSYMRTEVMLYPKSFNGKDKEALDLWSIGEAGQGRRGMDPYLITSIYEPVQLKVGEGGAILTVVEKPNAGGKASPIYNGLGALTKR